MTTKVSCYAAYNKDEELKPFTYETAPLGPTDVLVKIKCCGICHSDIHTIDSGWGPSNYPVVVGHEIIGTVIAKGPQVNQVNVGDRVGVGAQVWACLECDLCKKGHDTLCDKGVFTYNAKYADGSIAYGGYSDHIRVKQDWAFLIPESISDEHAAPLLCAGATTYSPLKRHGCSPGQKVGVVGIGGLGHLAVQYASKMGAKVTCISYTPSKAGDAKALGAVEFLDMNDAEAYKKHFSMFDIIVNTACAGDDLSKYLVLVSKAGTYIQLGAPQTLLTFNPGLVVVGQRTVVGSLIGSIADIKDMLAFSAKHDVKPWISTMKLDQVNEAIALVRKNQVKYRIVLKNE